MQVKVPISHYKIICEHQGADLARVVQEEINKGWQPFGGVSCHVDVINNTPYLYQPMIILRANCTHCNEPEWVTVKCEN